jgi:hypothetical protein
VQAVVRSVVRPRDQPSERLLLDDLEQQQDRSRMAGDGPFVVRRAVEERDGADQVALPGEPGQKDRARRCDSHEEGRPAVGGRLPQRLVDVPVDADPFHGAFPDGWTLSAPAWK